MAKLTLGSLGLLLMGVILGVAISRLDSNPSVTLASLEHRPSPGHATITSNGVPRRASSESPDAGDGDVGFEPTQPAEDLHQLQDFLTLIGRCDHNNVYVSKGTAERFRYHDVVNGGTGDISRLFPPADSVVYGVDQELRAIGVEADEIGVVLRRYDETKETLTYMDSY